MPHRNERIMGIPGTVVLWAVALVIAGLSITAVLAPSAARSSEASGIPVDRLRAHVDVLAQVPHPMGSAAIAAVRGHVVDALTSFGSSPDLQTVTAPNWYGAGEPVEITNVIARIPGFGDGRAILVMAHYDTVPSTPGANDNSTAVAALLEAVRVLIAAEPMRNDVIVLFTDAEEPTPRFGATAFSQHPWFADVALAINLEAIGDAGPSTLVEANGDLGALIDGLATIESPVAFSFVAKTAELIGGASTDFDVIREADLPGFNFTYLRGSSIYHSTRDDLSHVNEAGMAHHAAVTLGLIRHFGDRDLSELGGDGDTVFFTIPPWLLLRHPTSWVVAVAAVMVALLAVGLARTVSHEAFPWRAMLRGIGVALAGACVAGVVGALVWLVIAALRPTMSTTESYAYLVVLLALAGSAWTLAALRARATHAWLAGGMVVSWAALAVLVGVTAPEIGYLFAWPACAATIALAMRSFVPATIGWRLSALIIVAIPTAFLVTPAIDTFFLFATPRPGNPGSQLPMVVAASVILGYLAIGLIVSAADRDLVPSRERRA